MAETKKYLHNLDVSRNKVMNLLLNPLTTVQRTAIGGTLGFSDQSYVCFDTDLNQQYFWDGTQWIVVGGGSIGPGTTNYIPKWDGLGTDLIDSQIFDDGVYVRVGNGGGNMAFPYETLILEANKDMKFGSYTSVTAPNLGGASYVLGYTNFLTNLGYYPGFEFQMVGAAIDADNLIRYNFLQRDATGAVVASNANIFNIYADNRVSFKTLIGTGTEMVVANASGFISRQPIPTNPVTGTGTPTRVAFWDTSSSISSDADLYWDNVNKRLGVKTTTPNSTFDVNGWINAGSGLSISGSTWTSGVPASGGKITFNGSTLKYESVSGSGFSHSFFTNGFSRLYIDDTGVGIGTTSPAYKLDLVNTASPNAYYARFTNQDGTDKNAILLATSTSAAISLMGPSSERKILIGNGGTGRADFITYNSNYFNFSYSNALGGSILPASLIQVTPSFSYSSGNNSHNIMEIIPVVNLTGTVGTNTLRGFYYNPNVQSGTPEPSTHIAFENTKGDIIHGNLATGGAAQMVTADSTGKLGIQTIPTGLPPSGTASGDLSGTYPSPTVAKIQGKDISSTAPTTNQVLQYNGSSWVPATIISGGARVITPVTADVTGGTASGTDYVYLVNQTSLVTVTLPSASGNTNSYTIKKIGTGQVNIATTAGLIDGSASPITINVQYASVTLVSDGTNWFII